MISAGGPNDGHTLDHTIKVDSDQLALVGLGIDALAAGAGDRGAAERMSGIYEAIDRNGTRPDLIADCRSLYDIIVAAIESKA